MITRDLIKLILISTLTINAVAQAGANTGGYSGGNNGNGVGNTGPGNQGNDKPVGNAGGNANSGGSNGNTDNGNTGGFSGGNNGNGVGNTGPGNQGNDKPNGNACGNDCGTATTTTGSTEGGSTTGDLTTGSTDGGTTTGGTTTGETSGGTTTGETSGGSTTGETTGGETTGETSGGTTTGGVTESKPKEQFKARLLPLGFGNYDIQNKAVNLTRADDARLDEYDAGFQVTQVRLWDAGLGAMANVYLENASALASLANVAVGVAPTKGRYVQYERLVSDEKMVDKLKALPLPTTKKSLDRYQKGESAYFESNGGLVFLAGAGLSAVYAGGSVVAEGSYRTYVKKVSDDRAVVQIVKAKLRTTSLYAGALIVKLDGTRVKQLSEGFNYEFDFSRGGNLAVRAYEQLLAGNATLAQDESKRSDLSGVMKVSDAKYREITKKKGLVIGIPMVAIYNWSAGKIYGESATKAYADKTTTDLNYGVYFKEEKGRFFHKHKKITRAFYASKAVTKDESQKVLANNEEANFIWSYENDAASSATLKSAIALFNKDLGLQSEFSPVVEKGEKLQFIRLEANVNMPESFLKKVISESITGRSEEMKVDARNLVYRYFSEGDKLNLCKEDENSGTLANCQKKFVKESVAAVSRIQNALSGLANKKDASSYTYAMALMGKDLVKNQFVMNAFFAQDKSCSVNVDVKLEGRRLSRMMKKIPANQNCR